MSKPIKCWYCAHLGKCNDLKPCDRFLAYQYKKRILDDVLTTEKVAELCGKAVSTIRYWILSFGIDEAEVLIKSYSGKNITISRRGKIYIFKQVGDPDAVRA